MIALLISSSLGFGPSSKCVTLAYHFDLSKNDGTWESKDLAPGVTLSHFSVHPETEIDSHKTIDEGLFTIHATLMPSDHAGERIVPRASSQGSPQRTTTARRSTAVSACTHSAAASGTGTYLWDEKYTYHAHGEHEEVGGDLDSEDMIIFGGARSCAPHDVPRPAMALSSRHGYDGSSLAPGNYHDKIHSGAISGITSASTHVFAVLVSRTRPENPRRLVSVNQVRLGY